MPVDALSGCLQALLFVLTRGNRTFAAIKRRQLESDVVTGRTHITFLTPHSADDIPTAAGKS